MGEVFPNYITMRPLYLFLLLSDMTFGQVPTQPSIRRDSVPTGQRMPTVRPQNEFYRRTGDNPSMVRSTLDNMPIWMSDTSAVRMPTKGKVPRRRK